MRISGRRLILSLAGACAAACLLSALVCWSQRRPYFSERSRTTGAWVLACTSDNTWTTLALDEPSGTLFVSVGQGMYFQGPRGPTVKMGTDVKTARVFSDFDNDLLVGTTNGHIATFELTPGVAKEVFQATREKRCSDARELLLTLYEGPDREALREALGLNEDLAPSAPAGDADAGP